MKLENVELERLLPAFMREDKNFQAMMYALQEEIKRLNSQNNLIRLYVNLDGLQEEILDELAWQFNIPEYDVTFEVDVKRSIIRDCLSLHHRRGTVSAVQEVAEKIFGNAEVSEWFEYGGEPYHFKVTTTNISATDEMVERFRKVIRETQNVRSYLEEVIVDVMNSMELFFAAKVVLIDEVSMKTADY